MNETAPRIAQVVREAQSRLGTSPAELASLLGVSRLTVREMLEGRDCRASTLRKTLGALGPVLPTDLLGHEGRPPAPLASAWQFECRLLGARAKRWVREIAVGDDGDVSARTIVEGARPREAAKVRDAEQLAELLRLVVQGGGAVRARLTDIAERLARRQRVEPLEDAGTLHSFATGPQGALRYERREPSRKLAGLDDEVLGAQACLVLGSFAAAQLPVEQLVVTLALPAALRSTDPVPLAWLGPLVPDAGEPGLAGILRAPAATLAATPAGRSTLTLAQPPAGVVIALGWCARATPAAAKTARSRRGSTAGRDGLGRVLRGARESAGLSVRELGRRMSVGAMTISDMEGSRDVRASTLNAALSALPDLAAWDVIAPVSLSRSQAWSYRRDLFGCEVDVETKIVDISETGDAQVRIETKNLRLLAPRPGPLRLRVGFAMPTVTATRARLRRVAVAGDGADEIRISAVPDADDGERLHQLFVPERMARAGLTFTRELVHRSLYSLDAASTRERLGIPGPFHEGASFAAALPARELRLIVRFPPGAWPSDITRHAWSKAQAPDPAKPGVAAWLHPEGLRLTTNERRREIKLIVEQPILGAKYAVGWRLR